MTDLEIREYALAIDKLVKKGSIRKCQPCKKQFLSSFFLVDKPNGEKRFILNLKKLNAFIEPPHFKLEDHKTVIRILTPNCFMATLDLKDAFMLIPVAEDFKKYLRFEFMGTLYEFNCLPFGLCTAPFVFTKLLKPVAQVLRSEGLKSVIYLDDILLLGKTKEICHANIIRTKELLVSLGFIVNVEKSSLNPSQKCKFLGFMYDSRNFDVKLTQEKRKKILKLTNKFYIKETCKIRDFAQCIGVLVSACPAVNYGWLYTKNMERQKFLALKKSDNNFDVGMKLSQEVKLELDWWKRNVLISKNPIRDSSFYSEIFSDASLTGWGAYCQGEKTHGWWNLDERNENINMLELRAAFNALKCFASNYQSCQVLLRIDNTTAISYINRMGGVQFKNLSEIAKEIWQWCEKKNLWIFASYIKSKDNFIADKESRILPPETEWELNNKYFQLIAEKYGNFDIDLFATSVNNKCDKFVSWFKDPNSIAIDAFTISWTKHYFYAFPPFSIILKVLNKIIHDKAEGILIIPLWPTQPWFPLFLELLIEKPYYLSPKKDLLISPSRKIHPLAESLTLVAGRLSGKHS